MILRQLLGHLAGEPGLSYSELGRRAGVTAQSMQATLRQLEERGAAAPRHRTGSGPDRSAARHRRRRRAHPGAREAREWAP
ncbi:MAG: MarR family transcriptional regulator [Actinomycetota bacterium]|nr:MarR family transcriptional regulator [Actinomycetota bacterium]